jgi:hypothetical protein
MSCCKTESAILGDMPGNILFGTFKRKFNTEYYKTYKKNIK